MIKIDLEFIVLNCKFAFEFVKLPKSLHVIKLDNIENKLDNIENQPFGRIKKKVQYCNFLKYSKGAQPKYEVVEVVEYCPLDRSSQGVKCGHSKKISRKSQES